jgi:hypothetical protein
MFAGGEVKDNRYRGSEWNRKWALIPPHFGEEFRAKGSAFGSTNAMVARSLIHDSWWHEHDIYTGGHGKSKIKYTNSIVKMDRLPDPPGMSMIE